jgi:hypothetical protein
MDRDEKNRQLRALRADLRNARSARTKLFNAWKRARAVGPDDLSLHDRKRRRRLVLASKGQCLRVARQCADLELRILKAQME